MTNHEPDSEQGPFNLEEVRVDPQEGTVEVDGQAIRLQPKVMAVLAFMARHHGQIVSKETLLETVWAGSFVVDDALRRCMLLIRKALREDAKAPRFLETLPRRGYRLLVAPTQPDDVVVADTDEADLEPGPSTPDTGIAPFRGLEAFQAEHARFFFGRDIKCQQVMQMLRQQLDNGRGFVLLIGPSGSGKSSLARAALMPALCAAQSLDVPGPRFSCEFSIHTNPTAPLAQLARNIEQAIGASATQSDSPEQTFDDDADTALAWVTALLDEHSEQARLIVLLDQLEEWFTYADVDAATLTRFIDLLYTFARSGRIWIVAVMRSEFYPQFMQHEALRYLKQHAGQVDIDFPGASQIADIVRKPARLSGLTFDCDASGRPLDQLLIDSAAASPASLPLLEFALEQLYQRRENSTLRHADLEELGGLEGSLAKHAEDTYLALDPDARAALPVVLEHMLTVKLDLNRVTRRSARMDLFPENTPEHRMVTAMIDARLFSTHLDNFTGRPVVQFAHEAVLSHWARPRRWTEQNFATLRFLGWLSESAQRWQQGGRRAGDLIAGGQAMVEASRIGRSDMSLNDDEREFIRRSEQNVTKRARLRRAVTAALAILTVASLAFAGSAIWQGRIANQQQRVASAEAERARSTADFMATLFAGADPGSNEGTALSAAELLDRGAARIESGLEASPETKAALMTTMAEAYVFLGDSARAGRLIDSALQLIARIDSRVSRVPADVALEMTGLLRQNGSYDQALAFSLQALEFARNHGDPWLLVEVSNLRGLVLDESGANDEALALLKTTLNETTALAGTNHNVLASLHNNIALCYLEQSNNTAAAEHLNQAIDHDRQSGSVRYGAKANRLNNLAAVRDEQGQAAEALALYRESADLLRTTYGPQHPQLIRTLLNLGTLQMRVSGLEQAYESFAAAYAYSVNAQPVIHALVEAKLALCAHLLPEPPPDLAVPASDTIERLAAAFGADHRVVAEANAAIALNRMRTGGPDTEGAANELELARATIDASGDAIAVVLERIDAALRDWRAAK